jgi:diguanylate cyclase (GGDEF)-like protein
MPVTIAKRPQSQTISILVGVVALVAVFIVDTVTGLEIRVFPLYILPIAFVAWRVGSSAGLVFATAGAVAITLSDRLAGRVYQHAIFELVNVFSEFIGLGVVALLVAKLQENLARESLLSRIDPLTGLVNRRGFHEAAAAEWARSLRFGHPLTLTYFDIDDFKNLNDARGHDAGDRALVAFASALKAASREVDTVARFGGDEFVILFPETSEPEAKEILARIQAACRRSFDAAGFDLSTTHGAVSSTAASISIEEILGRVDILMYEAKKLRKRDLAR